MRSIKIARCIVFSLHSIWPQVMITADFEPNWEIITMLLRKSSVWSICCSLSFLNTNAQLIFMRFCVIRSLYDQSSGEWGTTRGIFNCLLCCLSPAVLVIFIFAVIVSFQSKLNRREFCATLYLLSQSRSDYLTNWTLSWPNLLQLREWRKIILS